MLRIQPFQGLCPRRDLVSEVACVPYDVVDRDEAATLAAGNPNSLLHVDRAEIGLLPDVSPYSDAVYEKARENFVRFQSQGVLQREARPCLYLYQQHMGAHVQTGIAATCHVDDYDAGLIKKHEKTRPDKEDDRTRLIGTLRADTGPVFLTYRDRPGIDTLATAVAKELPLYDFTAPDGIRHIVWRIEETSEIVWQFAALPWAYVADGHHRTASAVRVGRELREMNPNHTGAEAYNWFLAVLFPASQLQILPYNRVVKDLNGYTPDSMLGEIRRRFTVTSNAAATPSRPGHISMYLAGTWYGLAWEPEPTATPIGKLDVTGLQEKLLAPILGIDDPRTSKRIDFIGGIRGSQELVQLVDRGAGAVAFSMYPTTVDQLMDIADAGEIMPPKSTWFEPKLRSGLFIHTF